MYGFLRSKWRSFPNAFGGNDIGPSIASAATIAPTHAIHPVTGTAAIVNITTPGDPATWQGELILIAIGIFTWTAAGNIAIAGTMTAAGKNLHLVYNPATQKWYPDKVA